MSDEEILEDADLSNDASTNELKKFTDRYGLVIKSTKNNENGHAHRQPSTEDEASECDFSTTLLLWLFFGGFGIHRMYVGRVRSGVSLFSMTTVAIILFVIYWIRIEDPNYYLVEDELRNGEMFMIIFGMFILPYPSVSAFIDFIRICTKRFRDKYRLVVSV